MSSPSLPLKYIQIETTTTCNQRCHFCPVSVSKRPKATLSLEVLDSIIGGLKDYDIDTVFLNGFNEPTFDKTLIEKVQHLRAAGFKLHLNTNGSGLNPELIHALLDAGLQEITVNLSTLDAARYQTSRGSRDLPKVMAHIEHLLEQIEDTRVYILALGELNAQHAEDVKALTTHFEPLGGHIVVCPIADFAGKNTQVLQRRLHHSQLRGCSSQRHRQWLHFTPSAQAILCCQDYAEDYPVGDVLKQTPAEINGSERFEQLRRWIEGIEPAPDDFICRSCVFALGEEDYAASMRAFFCAHCQLRSTLGESASCQYCVVNEYRA